MVEFVHRLFHGRHWFEFSSISMWGWWPGLAARRKVHSEEKYCGMAAFHAPMENNGEHAASNHKYIRTMHGNNLSLAHHFDCTIQCALATSGWPRGS